MFLGLILEEMDSLSEPQLSGAAPQPGKPDAIICSPNVHQVNLWMGSGDVRKCLEEYVLSLV